MGDIGQQLAAQAVDLAQDIHLGGLFGQAGIFDDQPDLAADGAQQVGIVEGKCAQAAAEQGKSGEQFVLNPDGSSSYSFAPFAAGNFGIQTWFNCRIRNNNGAAGNGDPPGQVAVYIGFLDLLDSV